MQKLLVVLDLDETLIHASPTQLDKEEDFRVGKYFVYKRPYLEEFLREVGNRYHFAIWSSAGDEYVPEVVSQILPEGLIPAFVWSRQKCTAKRDVQIDEYGYYNIDGVSHYHFIKPFKKIKKQGFQLERSLMIDDSPHKIANSYGNAIYVSEFNGSDEQDDELFYLAKYLRTLEQVEDVRKVEKRGWKQRVEEL